MARKDLDRYDSAIGFVALTGFLSSDDVRSATEECERLLDLPPADRSPRDKVVQGTRHLYDLADRSAVIDEIVRRKQLLDVVVQIIGDSQLVWRLQ